MPTGVFLATLWNNRETVLGVRPRPWQSVEESAAGVVSHFNQESPMNSTIRLVLIIILVLLVIGLLLTWPYSANWGYYPSGGLGLLLLIVIVVLLVGKRG